MAYDQLSDFLSELQDDGQLVRIRAEVDPVLEIAEIVRRVCQQPDGGPALFFERVKGSTLPVVANILGSERRLCRALGVKSFDEVAQKLEAMLRPAMPENWVDKIRLVPQVAHLASLPPTMVRTAMCQQVVKLGRDVDLFELPALQSWPLEGGRFITAGQVFTVHPQSGIRDVGLHRVQIRDRASCSIFWKPQHDGYQNFLEAGRQGGEQMPVAISLGGDPVFPYMAAAPLPPHTDECLFGGFLRGRGIELVECRTIELDVPASAEIVIEGYIDPREEWSLAGPCGDRTGFYHLEDRCPTFRVTAVTHRANPMFPAMVFGKPPMEESWMTRATERIFKPLLKTVIPELVDYRLPRPGASQNFCFVSIRKSYPQQARKVMHAIWSLGFLMFSKIVVVVDEHVDVQNDDDVWFEVGANVHPGRDVVFCEGPTDPFDHAAPIAGIGHKMGLDATRKFSEEGHPRAWPQALEMPAELSELVSRRWAEYGLR